MHDSFCLQVVAFFPYLVVYAPFLCESGEFKKCLFSGEAPGGDQMGDFEVVEDVMESPMWSA